MIDRNKFESLADALASVEDLEAVKRALIREATIRQVVAESGESREVVADLVDATASMGEEAVLDLTEGEPTTLRDALGRYVERLAGATQEMDLHAVVGDLDALLTFSFPLEERGRAVIEAAKVWAPTAGTRTSSGNRDQLVEAVRRYEDVERA